MKELKCLRCGAKIEHLMQEKIQLGQTGLFLGDWPNIIAGALEVDIYGCRKCGKMEFHMPGVPAPAFEIPEFDDEDLSPEINKNIVSVSMDGIPQVRCPRCGKIHDFDHHHCPYCDLGY